MAGRHHRTWDSDRTTRAHLSDWPRSSSGRWQVVITERGIPIARLAYTPPQKDKPAFGGDSIHRQGLGRRRSQRATHRRRKTNPRLVVTQSTAKAWGGGDLSELHTAACCAVGKHRRGVIDRQPGWLACVVARHCHPVVLLASIVAASSTANLDGWPASLLGTVILLCCGSTGALPRRAGHPRRTGRIACWRWASEKMDPRALYLGAQAIRGGLAGLRVGAGLRRRWIHGRAGAGRPGWSASGRWRFCQAAGADQDVEQVAGAGRPGWSASGRWRFCQAAGADQDVEQVAGAGGCRLELHHFLVGRSRIPRPGRPRQPVGPGGCRLELHHFLVGRSRIPRPGRPRQPVGPGGCRLVERGGSGARPGRHRKPPSPRRSLGKSVAIVERGGSGARPGRHRKPPSPRRSLGKSVAIVERGPPAVRAPVLVDIPKDVLQGPVHVQLAAADASGRPGAGAGRHPQGRAAGPSARSAGRRGCLRPAGSGAGRPGGAGRAAVASGATVATGPAVGCR